MCAVAARPADRPLRVPSIVRRVSALSGLRRSCGRRAGVPAGWAVRRAAVGRAGLAATPAESGPPHGPVVVSAHVVPAGRHRNERGHAPLTRALPGPDRALPGPDRAWPEPQLSAWLSFAPVAQSNVVTTTQVAGTWAVPRSGPSRSPAGELANALLVGIWGFLRPVTVRPPRPDVAAPPEGHGSAPGPTVHFQSSPPDPRGRPRPSCRSRSREPARPGHPIHRAGRRGL